ncbi:hypothetical protein ABW19_dt0209623 [Dactylella cylindrospora]|nr:hypothetical protein ABW19_dt0209623 [Dactylella cylindrospora]
MNLLVLLFTSLTLLVRPTLSQGGGEAPEQIEVSFFPAIPALSEILQNSQVDGFAVTPDRSSTIWAPEGKRALGEQTYNPLTLTVTAYPSRDVQVFTYQRNPTDDDEEVAATEVECSIGTYSTARCTVTVSDDDPSTSTITYGREGFDLYTTFTLLGFFYGSFGTEETTQTWTSGTGATTRIPNPTIDDESTWSSYTRSSTNKEPTITFNPSLTITDDVTATSTGELESEIETETEVESETETKTEAKTTESETESETSTSSSESAESTATEDETSSTTSGPTTTFMFSPTTSGGEVNTTTSALSGGPVVLKAASQMALGGIAVAVSFAVILL